MSSALPAVSVIIPTFNRARFVSDAIDSVLAQVGVSVEVVVVDDGSTDDTREVLARYGDRIVTIHQPNRERGAARNNGLAHANGTYVAFLDADDIWLPNKLSTDLAIFNAKPSVGVVHSLVWFADASGRRYARQRSSPASGWVYEQLLVQNQVSFCTAIVRRDVLDDVGGFCEDRRLSGSEDWELWVRISARYEFWFHPTTTAVYRELPDGTLRNPVRMRSALFRAIELMYDEHPAVPTLATPQRRKRAVARANMLLANQYYATGDRAGGLRHLRMALRSQPRGLVDRATLVVVVRLFLPARASAVLRELKRRILLWITENEAPAGGPDGRRVVTVNGGLSAWRTRR